MKDLRKDLEKILLELLCKWDKGGLAEEEAEDKILSLFKQQMKGIIGKDEEHNYGSVGEQLDWVEGRNQLRKEILKNIESL